ncbi:MAG: class I SAM-dependent methyltransferase [Sedimentisphaerales bacterium]|nr:class I SAM-dependent methyltransferase [Sedimentisphaerales bacterium]MBN2844069.1 class I SAM-dependent methyltransferase [Sedimentisphaerales bacterium]
MIKEKIRYCIPQSLFRSFKRVKLAFQCMLWRGNAVYCPVCQRRYRSFISDAAYCPGCQSLSRHRLLVKYLEAGGLCQTGQRVLDIGPNWGLKKYFGKVWGNDYYCSDLCSPEADYHFNIQNIPYAEGYFDGIICYHVLEHCDNDDKALAELYRVLKPGGWAIIEVPYDKKRMVTFEEDWINTPQLRLEHYGQQDHVRIYGRDFVDKYKAAGFEFELIDFANILDESSIAENGLQISELIFRCLKGE